MLIIRQIEKLCFMVNFFGSHRRYHNKKIKKKLLFHKPILIVFLKQSLFNEFG